MTTIIKKLAVAGAVVIGLGLGGGAQVSAGLAPASHLLPGDGVRGSITSGQVTALDDTAVCIHPRHRIGWLAGD
jgi:hypothetical protein